jgi:hypothetical protein
VSLVTFSLLVAILAPVGGIVYVVKKGLQLFRDARGFFGALGETSERLARATDKLASFEPPDTERLATSMARVRASRERLSIELGALERVKEQWAGLLAVYPRK